ncbi:MAG: glucose 1-dehydrogenase [Gammaproteobacteria bacterium]|nr:glucose 1-dehydrogenase [Gammaproteobacteria bacterium]
MANKVILITGASRGIGAATAIAAAQQGWQVCINYRNRQAEAEQLVSRIKNSGGRASCFAADVSQQDQVQALFQFVDSEFGRLDALVNNAGIIDQKARLEDMNQQRLERMFHINVVSSFLCAGEAVRRMGKSRGGEGGAIVNVSSVASRLGSPGEFVDYAASKGAIDTMSIGLAKEVAAEGIRVNAVRPGLIETDIHADTGDIERPVRLAPSIPMQRTGQPEEVASCILWLLSEQAGYVTGSILDVAGGR